jgi:hypothetical protein
MFFIPGIAITMLTFPGVIVHELAHQLFCRLFKIPVFEVVYFQMKNPAGYVLHETPQSKWQTMMISVGPFVLNTLLGTGDANVIWETMKEEDTPLWIKIVGYPVVGLIYLGSIGSFFWLDLLYGIGVAIGLPNLIIWLMA